MKNRYYSNSTSNFMIIVDSYADGILTGRFYQFGTNQSKTFLCLSQLILWIDQIMDELNYPQSSCGIRSMAPLHLIQGCNKEDLYLQTGDIATFSLRIMFRHNASWQGSVLWLEEGIEHNFRSVLEFMVLLTSAVSKKQPDFWELPAVE